MAAGNLTVEAAIVENGKLSKGYLSLFKDEYSFGSTRKTVNWERVVCKKETVTVKAFLRTAEKECLVFEENGSRSVPYVLEQEQMDSVLNAVRQYAADIKQAREEKERKAREAEEQKRRQIAEEKRIREEAKQKADEEYRQRKAEERRQKEEQERLERERLERRLAEKQERIRRAVEQSKAEGVEENPTILPIAQKAGGVFLNNPYRVLGISCSASNEEANTALDKLKKLARLKALASYRSAFDLVGLEKPIRDLSIAQNALSSLKDKNNKWFWFAESDPCSAWQNGKYRMELARDGFEYGSYDLFLANYLYAVLCDSGFAVAETWKRVLNFYCFLCKQEDCAFLRSRFSDRELQDMSNGQILNNFRNAIFKPILLLCERDDLDAVLRLYNCIKDCDDRMLDNLSRNVLGKLVSWFTDKEADVLRYLNDFNSLESVSEEKGAEIRERGDAYCKVVEPVLALVLRDFRGDAVRYDMIRESYRHVTYQLMFELHKCSDQSNAIFFANKCFSYCNADDKKRIQNTFGAVNIKVVDWNIPHTGWDVKGDEFYYGRGCPVDYTQALYWYHKAADAGNMYAPNSIGLCYQKGTGVPQNDELAATWFEKACEKGNPEGAYRLAECYFSGTGVAKNIDQALKYWAEAAKLGHPSAEQRRNSVFATVQAERRTHRAKNHICHDIGFQMTTGPNLVAEVTLNQAAYAYLVNAQGYQNYLSGGDFSYRGGYTTTSPYRIRIPSSNRWYVIVDNGSEPITGIVSSVKVKNA